VLECELDHSSRVVLRCEEEHGVAEVVPGRLYGEPALDQGPDLVDPVVPDLAEDALDLLGVGAALRDRLALR
jgi:hypothetical protein